MILDEATSALDSASEDYIKNAINTLKQRYITVIIIAHRLSTIMGADKIIVLEKGMVTEEGSHKELIKLGQKYYQMWQRQFPVLERLNN